MRLISAETISEKIKNLCLKANYRLPADVVKELRKSEKRENLPLAKYALINLRKNIEIAGKDEIPLCQDTGLVVVFAEIGCNVRIIRGSFNSAVNQGVREAYAAGYFRNSIVLDPLARINSGDNTPAVIHTEIAAGNKIKLSLMVKGAGSENMSSLKMLTPADGKEGMVKFVLETVKNAGANPCPPMVVGVGIGGTFEKAAILAKKALLRKIGRINSNKFYAALENTLLTEINNLGIGPEGFGGKTTALAVNIETYPCHLASLPVAVNIGCYASRHQEAVI